MNRVWWRWLAAALCGGLCLTAIRVEPLQADPPQPPATVSAIEYAKRDVARATEHARRLGEAAAAVAQKATAAAAAATAAVAEQKAAEREIPTFTERLQSVQQAHASATKTRLAIEALTRQTTDAEVLPKLKTALAASLSVSSHLAAAVVEQQTLLLRAQQRLKIAGQAVTATVAELKSLTESKAVAEKSFTESLELARSAVERSTWFDTRAPTLDPEGIHLLQTYKHTSGFLNAQVDPTGEHVYAGGLDGSVQRWDLFSGDQTGLTGKSWVRGLACHGKLLISTTYTGQAIWWDTSISPPKQIRSVAAHKGFARAAAFSPDGQYVATSGDDHMVRIWQAATGEKIAELAGHESHVYHLAFHPGGQHLVSGDLMGVTRQWEVGTWKHVRNFDSAPLHTYDKQFAAHCGGIRAIAFSPDGKWLALGGMGEVTNAFAGIGVPMVLLFDWQTGKQQQVMKPASAFTGSVWGLEFDPSGRYLIAAGGGGAGAMWIWKTSDAKAIKDFKLPSPARGLSLHPDGFRVAIPFHDKTVRIYDLSAPPPAIAAK